MIPVNLACLLGKEGGCMACGSLRSTNPVSFLKISGMASAWLCLVAVRMSKC